MKRMIALALSLALSLCACSTSSQIPTLGEIVENGAEIEHITVTSLEEGSSADDEQQTAPRRMRKRSCKYWIPAAGYRTRPNVTATMW